MEKGGEEKRREKVEERFTRGELSNPGAEVPMQQFKHCSH